MALLLFRKIHRPINVLLIDEAGTTSSTIVMALLPTTRHPVERLLAAGDPRQISTGRSTGPQRLTHRRGRHNLLDLCAGSAGYNPTPSQTTTRGRRPQTDQYRL